MFAYDLVDDWVRAAGRPTAGSSREIYHPGFRELTGADPAVDVAQPIEGRAR
jgi:hypothetical protein